MLAFCFPSPKFYQKTRILFLCLFCLLACFLLNSTLHPAHAVLNSTIAQSKLFLVASDGGSPCGLGGHTDDLGLRVSGSNPMPLPWHCTLPETVPLILRPGPRTITRPALRCSVGALQGGHVLCKQTPPTHQVQLMLITLALPPLSHRRQSH